MLGQAQHDERALLAKLAPFATPALSGAELEGALLAHDSAVVQMLLETCLRLKVRARF